MGACQSNSNKFIKHGNITTNNDHSTSAVSTWDVYDVFMWLQSIDDGELSAVAQKAKKKKINGKKLISLTDNALNQMKIGIDHQKRLKRAINIRLAKDMQNDGDKGGINVQFIPTNNIDIIQTYNDKNNTNSNSSTTQTQTSNNTNSGSQKNNYNNTNNNRNNNYNGSSSGSGGSGGNRRNNNDEKKNNDWSKDHVNEDSDEDEQDSDSLSLNPHAAEFSPELTPEFSRSKVEPIMEEDEEETKYEEQTVKHKSKNCKLNNNNNSKKRQYGKLSYRPMNNVSVPKRLVEEEISKMSLENNISNYYSYIEKCIAIQQCDKNEYNNGEICIIPSNLYAKQNKNELYIICSPFITQKKRTYKVDKLLTQQQIKKEYKNISMDKLPKSKGLKEIFNDINLEKIEQAFSNKINQKKIMIQTKWHKLMVFNGKMKKKISLSIQKKEFMSKLQECMDTEITNHKLIPIVMFNHQKRGKNEQCYEIHYINIVSIIRCIDIGISYKYNDNKNEFEATGIHLNKNELIKQHELISQSHLNECKCFDHFQSNVVTHFFIGDRENDLNQKVNNLQKTNEKLKREIDQLQKTIGEKCVEII